MGIVGTMVTYPYTREKKRRRRRRGIFWLRRSVGAFWQLKDSIHCQFMVIFVHERMDQARVHVALYATPNGLLQTGSKGQQKRAVPFWWFHRERHWRQLLSLFFVSTVCFEKMCKKTFLYQNEHEKAKIDDFLLNKKCANRTSRIRNVLIERVKKMC